MTVHHGEFTYRNLDKDTKLCAAISHRTGSWTRNSYEEPLTHEEGDLFCAYIPVEMPSYAYAVTPRGAALGAKVVSNTSECQAILLDDGTLMAVFHTDASIVVEGKTVSGEAKTCLIKALA